MVQNDCWKIESFPGEYHALLRPDDNHLDDLLGCIDEIRDACANGRKETLKGLAKKEVELESVRVD
jgi:hypothetical protein